MNNLQENTTTSPERCLCGELRPCDCPAAPTAQEDLSLKINAYYKVPENDTEWALATLQDLHFDTFNAHESALKKSERNRHMKGMTILSHAFDHLRKQTAAR